MDAYLLIITVTLRILVKAAAIISRIHLISAATLSPTTNISSAIQAAPDSMGWIQFCNDDWCQEGCGEYVSISNPGCLQESGRRSFNLLNGNILPLGGWGMVYTPNDQCSCKSECLEHDTNAECYQIDETLAAETLSFRLLTSEGPHGACWGSVNNC